MGKTAIAKGVSVLLAATLALLVLAPAASAQSYPPCPPPTMGVDVKFAAAGDDVVVAGSNWAPNTTVDIYLNGTFATTADVGPDGKFRTTVRIPEGTPPGPVEVTVEGLDDPCQETRILGQTITVTTSGGARSAGDLPFTGADISVWMVVLAGLLVVGGSFALISRRRENRARR